MLSIPVQGSHVSVNWGSTYHNTQWDPYPTWFATYEQPSQSYTCSYITSLAQAEPNWVAANNYGSSTRSSYVYANSQAIQGSGTYDFLATFHVGDMYLTDVNGERHYNYYSSFNPGTTEGISDRELYNYTGSKHRFTFIYTCVNGGLIDPDNDGDFDGYGYMSQQYPSTGAVGMPFAWTLRADLSWDGFANPDYSGYCYIGFQNTSKWTCDTSGLINHNYGEFVRRFYDYSLNYHYSIITSLNWAMQDMTNWQQSFQSSELYNGYWLYDPAHNVNVWCKMRVIGDGGMALP